MIKKKFVAICGLLALLTLASCDSKVMGLLQTDVRNATTPKAPPSTDTILPTGAIAIEGGAAATNNSLALLNLTASDSDGVDKMWISNSSTFATGAWEAYSSTKSGWPLTAGVSSADGVKTVYVKYRDVAGNESIPYSDTIKYDTTKPVGNSVRVAVVSGASTSYPMYITSSNVALEVKATDATSGVSQVFISEDSNFATGAWAAYGGAHQLTLTTGFGLKTFYAKFRDAVGYESTPISGTVYLDDAYEASFGNGDGDDPYELYTSERGSKYYYNSTSSPSALANQFYTQNYPGYAVLNDVDRYWIYADTTMDTLHVEVQMVNGGSGPVYLELRDLNDLNPIYGTGSPTAKSVELYVSGGIPQGWYTIRISGPANSGQQYNLLWWTDWTGN